MSWARIYRDRADRYTHLVNSMTTKTGLDSMVVIAATKRDQYEKFAATAARWVVMAETMMDQRPGGFPGDPHNSTTRVALK